MPADPRGDRLQLWQHRRPEGRDPHAGHGRAPLAATCWWATRSRVDDVMFSSMPFFWIGGLSPGFSGAARRRHARHQSSFEPGAALDLIEQERATIVTGWPQQGKTLREHPTYTPRPCPSVVRTSMADLVPPAQGPPEVNSTSLGMTEMCSVHLSWDQYDPLPDSRRGTFGKTLPGISHKVVDPDTLEEVPVGDDGELWARGYSLMHGLQRARARRGVRARRLVPHRRRRPLRRRRLVLLHRSARRDDQDAGRRQRHARGGRGRAHGVSRRARGVRDRHPGRRGGQLVVGAVVAPRETPRSTPTSSARGSRATCPRTRCPSTCGCARSRSSRSCSPARSRSRNWRSCSRPASRRDRACRRPDHRRGRVAVASPRSAWPVPASASSASSRATGTTATITRARAPTGSCSLGKQWTSSPNVRRLPADYPIDLDDSEMVLGNFNGVGGGTILYNAVWPRLLPSDFHTHRDLGIGDDWPLSYSELLPFYEETDRQFGVSGLGGNPAYPPGADPPLPPLPIGRAGIAPRTRPRPPRLALVARVQRDPVGRP